MNPAAQTSRYYGADNDAFLRTIKCARSKSGYLRAAATVLNVPLRVTPIDCAPARTAIEIMTAISAYSMAVTPESSCINRRIEFIDNAYGTTEISLPVTARMIKTAMPAAMRPYSVAPDSSSLKRKRRLFTMGLSYMPV
jgi:hypothetical protein